MCGEAAFVDSGRRTTHNAIIYSCFALPQIKFCGQIVGSGTRCIDPEKIAAALEAVTVPQTKKQVRQVMGLFNYFRDNIPNFANMARPLTELTKKEMPNKVVWTEAEQRAFDTVKTALRKAADSPLFIIDMSTDFNLLVDAGDHTVAGVLTQHSAEGVERPIAFFSWKLNKTQQSWATVEKEAYTALKTLQ